MKRELKRALKTSGEVICKETLIDFKEHISTFIGAFIGIGLIAFIQSHIIDEFGNLFLIGSFGASSVLVYGVIQSPLAQPRNLIGGHFVSAIIGVTIFKLIPEPIWLSAPLAVSISIVVMQITKTLHPPGGATALIAVIGNEKIKALGYFYILFPVLTGSLILLIIALIFNNMTNHRGYPTNKSHFRKIKKVFNPKLD